jgi:uncharacterized protein (DUF1810 family)
MARDYAIQSREEAMLYLGHPVLGSRVRECCEALLTHKDRDVRDIMGSTDDLKLRSSMTLFAALPEAPSLFQDVLDAFYAGRPDERTLRFLNSSTPTDPSTDQSAGNL